MIDSKASSRSRERDRKHVKHSRPESVAALPTLPTLATRKLVDHSELSTPVHRSVCYKRLRTSLPYPPVKRSLCRQQLAATQPWPTINFQHHCRSKYSCP